MTEARIYTLDSNVFITAKNVYYAFDIAPGFWDSIVENTKNNRIHILDKVAKEAQRGSDDYKNWLNKNLKKNVISSDEETTIGCYSDVTNWVNGQTRFKSSEIAKFFGGADPWLIAYAKAYGLIVVTLEVPAPNGSVVKIPDVCKGLGVQWIDTFIMLRELGVQFQSGRTAG